MPCNLSNIQVHEIIIIIQINRLIFKSFQIVVDSQGLVRPCVGIDAITVVK